MCLCFCQFLNHIDTNINNTGLSGCWTVKNCLHVLCFIHPIHKFSEHFMLYSEQDKTRMDLVAQNWTLSCWHDTQNTATGNKKEGNKFKHRFKFFRKPPAHQGVSWNLNVEYNFSTYNFQLYWDFKIQIFPPKFFQDTVYLCSFFS